MHRAARIPKAPAPERTRRRLFWMAAAASPRALPTMGTPVERASLAALLAAASTWAFTAVWTERTPAKTVTAVTRLHFPRL